jgi:phage shock protein PspC (stress-responsive transcriptional regulator)
MQKVIAISLSGHTRQFRLTEEAYDLLGRYLDSARARVAEADRDEVAGDLERSIGERLDALAPDDRVLDATQVRPILDDIGAVDAGRGTPAGPAPTRPGGKRKLYRIREGQDIAGVCTGISAYSDIGIDWVRFTFLALIVFTAGIVVLLYIVLAFALPIVETREDWLQAMAEEAQRA